jgi:Ran GTPase-activating protein (RanGAP) involved in mRNA processing and transport
MSQDKRAELEELREFVYVRCQADDHDTDEVMKKILSWHTRELEPLRQAYDNLPQGMCIVRSLNEAIKQTLGEDK